MENSIYIGLSRQVAIARDMQVIANNIANLNTPGYRSQNLIFEEYIDKQRGGDDALSFVSNKGQYDVTAAGPIKATDNPLDIALNGPGFIGILDDKGETVYTRAGNFTLDADGTLITPAGYQVSGGGSPISIPDGSTEIKIDEKGKISNQDGEIGQIDIVEFKDLQRLSPLGNNTYKAEGAPIPADNTVVKQGFLEGANVNAVLEMSRMIETMRSFQQVQNGIEGEHERLRSAIQKLTSN